MIYSVIIAPECEAADERDEETAKRIRAAVYAHATDGTGHLVVDDDLPNHGRLYDKKSGGFAEVEKDDEEGVLYVSYIATGPVSFTGPLLDNPTVPKSSE